MAKNLFEMPELLNLNGLSFNSYSSWETSPGSGCKDGCESGCATGCDTGTGKGDTKKPDQTATGPGSGIN